ncbi:MAG: V-type ATP synthase subunit A [Trueperaceae bacterium]|nr:MAG: V-type ATP synthase subunit A [Trueperaceae bacterium]
MKPIGTIIEVNGPVVEARIREGVGLLEQVWVGEMRLAGEVIALKHDEATLQVYEETSGLRAGEPLFGSGELLSLTLGPGLIGSVFDGVQRRLEVIKTEQGIYIQRGATTEALPERGWRFSPSVEPGCHLHSGALLGVVSETPLIEHRILVPPSISGTLIDLVEEGEYQLNDRIALVRAEDGQEHVLGLTHRWPVRQERPHSGRLEPGPPLVTGQRILDTFFPLSKGGTAALPGPFGAGKTVLQHALVKWSNAEVIVYVGCGERGNEMANVLEELPELTDPWSGRPLMERTILVANTSNMPVAAREASIYTGITLAEYYRDQGYHVALMADSTSRWAEALREIAGRLEEMPAEEGYPAYLPSRLAAFYERAGRVRTLAGEEGAITIIGAVSPPGGDFTEPVTQHTQRFTRAFWALDRSLAGARHYPAINWQTSYSFYSEVVAPWWQQETQNDWLALRAEAASILEQDARLQQLVRLVGAEALPDRQRWVLEVARLLKEGFLQQNALHLIDAYCVPERQVYLLKLFVRLFELGRELLEAGIPLLRVRQALDLPRLLRLKEAVSNEQSAEIGTLQLELEARFKALEPTGEEG